MRIRHITILFIFKKIAQTLKIIVRMTHLLNQYFQKKPRDILGLSNNTINYIGYQTNHAIVVIQCGTLPPSVFATILYLDYILRTTLTGNGSWEMVTPTANTEDLHISSNEWNTICRGH